LLRQNFNPIEEQNPILGNWKNGSWLPFTFESWVGLQEQEAGRPGKARGLDADSVGRVL
jgi:hypothetical protein